MSPQRAPRRPVLVIDDHEDIRDGLRRVLEVDGYVVETAGNGHEALTKLHDGLRPCIIILDLMMPVMNGYEFREAQLRDRALRDIPVLAFSAVTDARANAQQLDVKDFLDIPIDVERILTAVRTHCLDD